MIAAFLFSKPINLTDGSLGIGAYRAPELATTVSTTKELGHVLRL